MSELDRHFQGLWKRALSHGPEKVTPDVIQTWGRERGLTLDDIQLRDVGRGASTPAITFAVEGQRACIPLVPPRGAVEWERRRQAAEARAAAWERMEWFEPLWIPGGKVAAMLNDVARLPPERAASRFDYHASTIYTLGFQAVCIAQILSKCPILSRHVALAREAYLAFYSGHRASSVAALIPIIEGALKQVFESSGDFPGRDNAIDKIIDGAISRASSLYFEGMWVPSPYKHLDYLLGLDELVLVFETFRRWLRKSFFSKTENYTGASGLNRHLFAHAVTQDWYRAGNFGRLIVALATLSAIISWYRDETGGSLWFPEMDDDSRLLWQEGLFQTHAQMALTHLRAERFHQDGKLVPELPTDSGVTLRAALLTEDCVNDLVRPLRDAGWFVEMGEPDNDALWVGVTASASASASDGDSGSDSDRQLKVALLYSCATANDLYRDLASRFDVILYRGAPYKQNEFTRGIEVYVGPVAGWQPPRVASSSLPGADHPAPKLDGNADKETSARMQHSVADHLSTFQTRLRLAMHCVWTRLKALSKSALAAIHVAAMLP